MNKILSHEPDKDDKIENKNCKCKIKKKKKALFTI